jgi:hypothetical protein
MYNTIRTVLLLAAIVVWTPAKANAEGYFNPWAGVNFGDDADESRGAFGADVGYMGNGIAGVEFDFGYAPDFFGESTSNHVLTGMANVIVGAPVGGTSGPGIRPYVVAGLGLIRTSLKPAGVTVANNDAGFNVGGGVIGFFSEHAGLRGDIRYLRNFGEIDLSESQLAGDFRFWRATIGLVFR